MMTRLALILLVGLMTVPSQAEGNPADIPEERYVRVVDGQLHADGERQRFWGVIGQLFVRPDIKPNDTPDEIAALVAQSQKRSAVFDIITNPGNVFVTVD